MYKMNKGDGRVTYYKMKIQANIYFVEWLICGLIK